MSNSGSALSAQLTVNNNEYIYEIREGEIKVYHWDAFTSGWVKSAGNADPLVRAPHDSIVYEYTSTYNTKKIFKTGGVSGSVVATVTMTYDVSGLILTATRTSS